MATETKERSTQKYLISSALKEVRGRGDFIYSNQRELAEAALKLGGDQTFLQGIEKGSRRFTTKTKENVDQVLVTNQDLFQGQSSESLAVVRQILPDLLNRRRQSQHRIFNMFKKTGLMMPDYLNPDMSINVGKLQELPQIAIAETDDQGTKQKKEDLQRRVEFLSDYQVGKTDSIFKKEAARVVPLPPPEVVIDSGKLPSFLKLVASRWPAIKHSFTQAFAAIVVIHGLAGAYTDDSYNPRLPFWENIPNSQMDLTEAFAGASLLIGDVLLERLEISDKKMKKALNIPSFGMGGNDKIPETPRVFNINNRRVFE